MILRSIFQLLSPAGQQARLSILIFHRVHEDVDPLFPGEPHARRFHELMEWVARWFRVMPLDAAVDALFAGRLPARAAAITFDDGYADNATTALAILRYHALPATFFIATSFVEGGRMWNDTIIEAVRRTSVRRADLSDFGLGHVTLGTAAQRRAVIDGLLDRIKYLEPSSRAEAVLQVQAVLRVTARETPMLTIAQLLKLRDAGMQIGAHTCTHPILARTGDDMARDEIVTSKATLESLLRQPVSLFAYPNGKPEADYAARHVEMVRDAGFRVAVSTAAGNATVASDALQLPRFSPWDRQRARYAARMMVNLRRGPEDAAAAA